MAGVTPSGFEAKRLADILSDAEAQLATIVDPANGENLQPDFGSEDPTMQVVKVPLDGVGAAWEALQLVFQQFDPTKATGPSLRALVQLNGLSAQPATPSTVVLRVAGTPGVTIPAGQLVSDVDNTNQWVTDEDVEIDGGGIGDVGATCQTFGPVAAAIGTLTSIVTPFPGWASVTNLAEASLGRDAETDTELRLRRARSTLAPAASPVESVYANLANVPGVTYVRVYQNNTLVTDVRGVPPKSVAAVVVGGADLDIAYVLLARTGVSAAWFGNTTVNLFDVQNEPYAVRFTRPTPKLIYVRVEIQIYNTNIFPADGIDQIKQAIIDYAEGGAPALGIDDGFSEFGFPPGAPVIVSRLYTPLNYVPGHRVVSLLVDDVFPPVGSTDVTVAFDEYAQFVEANIDVVVLP